MSDVICPYCGNEQEVNHDDGYGYDEDVDHEQRCAGCGKEFQFTTSISFSYESFCQKGDHSLVPFGDKWPHMYECEKCDHYERRDD